ncbi:MAG: LysE family translocator [Pseudomonadota bacterium]
MIDWALLLLFAPACFAINIAPGPNNLLAFATSARAGAGVALIGGAGRLAAFAAMIALAAAGLGILLLASEIGFAAVKLAGAAYLIWVGYKLWTAPVPREAHGAVRVRPVDQIRNEFLIAAGNPKAIATFIAFFPQFVDTAQPIAIQFLILGIAFLLLEGLALALYVVAGRVARRLLERPSRLRLLNRGTGAFLIGSGVTLALSQRA